MSDEHIGDRGDLTTTHRSAPQVRGVARRGDTEVRLRLDVCVGEDEMKHGSTRQKDVGSEHMTYRPQRSSAQSR